jgi:hypothetical protein
MGYLNKATITVDAILTNRGRELLAEQGTSSDGLAIAKFALSDDEVDYGLYNAAHPEGSDYYGYVIENMPVLEATPDEQQIMRYKLLSLDALGTAGSPFIEGGIVKIPTLNGLSDRTLSSTNDAYSPQISTNPTFAESYVLTVANANLFEIRADNATSGPILNTASAINANGSITLTFAGGSGGTPKTLFTLKRIANRTGLSTTITIYGVSTGATASATITVE